MRFMCRSFLAVILFSAVAGFVAAQNSNAPAPAPEPVVTPVAELPPVPVAEPIAPAAVPDIVPAPEAMQTAPVVEPAAPAAVVAPETEKAKVTTTKRVTTKTVKKVAEKPAVETKDVKPAAAAAGLAAVDTAVNPPPPNPPAVAASTVPLQSVAPAPAPAAKPSVVETGADQAEPQKKLGIGSWVLFAFAFVALSLIARKFLRRPTRGHPAIVDLGASNPDLKPIPVPRS